MRFFSLKYIQLSSHPLKNIVCSKQPYSQSLPWVSEVVSIILTWQSGLPGYSCREAPPSLLPCVQGDLVESAVTSACLEKIMHVSSFLHCVI